MLLIPWLLLPLVHWHMVTAVDKGATKADVIEMEARIHQRELMMNTTMDSIAKLIKFTGDDIVTDAVKRTDLGTQTSYESPNPQEDPPPESTADERETGFNTQIDAIERNVDEKTQVIKDRIVAENAPNKEEKLRQVEENANKVKEGAQKAKKKYQTVESNAAGGRKEMNNLKKFWANVKPSGDIDVNIEKAGMIAEALGNIQTLIDPDEPWQARTEAGLAMAASLIQMIPPPVGTVGSAILSLAASCFGAAAPSPNEYRELRNQIFEGVKNMFDGNQQAEAMGCIYKIEFLKNILDIHESEEMTEKEFYALIMVGGIDVGVATLGTMKYKMEQYRDENNIPAGRRALEMAHFYILVSQARDLLYDQIIKFIALSAGSKAGMTVQFFENTKIVSQAEFKHFFWLDDACCEKEPDHFSTLLAYNMPIGKHYGAGKAHGIIKKFLKKHRTQKYYDNPHFGMTAKFALSVDIADADSTTVRKGSIKDRLPDERYHAFENLGTLDKFLGFQPFSFVKVRGLGNGPTMKLICNPDVTGGYVMELGIVDNWHIKDAKLKLTYSDSDDTDPAAATVSFKYKEKFWTGGNQRYNGYHEYFLTTHKSLAGVSEKLLDDASQNEDSSIRGDSAKERDADYTSELKKEFSSIRKKWDLFAMCKEGKEYAVGDWGYTSSYGGTSYTKKNGNRNRWTETMEHGRIRLFRIMMTGWVEPRYMVGPSGEYLDDDLVVVGANTGQGASNIQRLPAAEVDAEKPTKMTKAQLDKDTWKAMQFVIRYDSPSFNSGGDGKFPVVIDNVLKKYTCKFQSGKSWTKGQLSADKTSYGGKSPDDCIAFCLAFKNKYIKSDTSYGGVTTYDHDKSNNGYCYCLTGTPGEAFPAMSSYSDYQGCFFQETV